MQNVLLVIHLLLAVALIIVVLLQRTAQDGGGLTGGGSTMGGLFTARGSANLMTRTTAVLATSFLCTSLVLSILAGLQHKERSVLDQIAPVAPASTPDKAAKPASASDEKPSAPVDKAGKPSAEKPSAPNNEAGKVGTGKAEDVPQVPVSK